MFMLKWKVFITNKAFLLIYLTRRSIVPLTRDALILPNDFEVAEWDNVYSALEYRLLINNVKLVHWRLKWIVSGINHWMHRLQ